MSLINVLVHKRESAATVTGETCFDTKIDTALMYKKHCFWQFVSCI